MKLNIFLHEHVIYNWFFCTLFIFVCVFLRLQSEIHWSLKIMLLSGMWVVSIFYQFGTKICYGLCYCLENIKVHKQGIHCLAHSQTLININSLFISILSYLKSEYMMVKINITRILLKVLVMIWSFLSSFLNPWW